MVEGMRRPDRPRGDTVYPDSFLSEQLRPATGEILNGTLCRGIGQKGGAGHVGVDLGRVDYGATFLRVGRRRLRR